MRERWRDGWKKSRVYALIDKSQRARSSRPGAITKREVLLITGAQIRKARELLCWRAWKVARQAGVRTEVIRRAEKGNERPLNELDALAIRQALETAGVEFANDEASGVSLRLIEIAVENFSSGR